MSAREISFRIARSLSIQFERLRGPSSKKQEPNWKRLDFDPSPIPDTTVGPYISKANGIADGYLDVFSLKRAQIGCPPKWNTDPLTQIHAPLKFGKSIDYRDETLVGNIKYLWEPSRHLQLVPLAQAFRLTGKRKYTDSLVNYVWSWIQQCPYPKGVHWCSSLEVSIRLLNWSQLWRIVGGVTKWEGAGANRPFIVQWLQSIYQHLEFIDGYYSKYSSANNHLIGEAAGVYVGSVTWPAWEKCQTWRMRAKAILIREAQKQTFQDGVNKEQAIAYQQFVLDFLIAAGIAGDNTGDPFPDEYWKTIDKMLEFVAALMDANGNMPMIGDADDGYVFDLAAEPGFSNFSSVLVTGGLLVGRSAFLKKVGRLDSKTSWLIDNARERFEALHASQKPEPAIPAAYPYGGYYVLGFETGSENELLITADCGPLGMGSLAAHGHADALAFTLSSRGIPMLIDPGTYAYHTEKKWRDYFRGTSAHNTLRLDGVDQSEIAGNFMWHNHANAYVDRYNATEHDCVLEAHHDGYLRLSDPVTHRRSISLDRHKRRIRVEDTVECIGQHEVEIFFHLSENAAVAVESDNLIITVGRERMILSVEHNLVLDIIKGESNPPGGWISYHFDQKVPSTTLRYSGHIHGTTVFAVNIECP